MANPVGITHAFLDLDPVAYTGASIAQKMAYQWKHDTDESLFTEVFKNAAEAKRWYEGEVEFEMIDPAEWTRHKIEVIQPLEIALKGVDWEMAKWLKTVRDLTKNPDIKFKGWLTCSGRKNKDIEGLQDRYQFVFLLSR